jgi:hypothetical protein
LEEIMYDQSSILITLVLFACILLVIEVGFRLGRRLPVATAESIKPQINAILAAVLGVLALLLGFTFSLALQRYDSRSQAAVDEANAIGTAYLRAQLLPASMRAQVGALLRDYLDFRIQAGDVNLAAPSTREPLLHKASQITEQLWLYARQAAEQDGRSVTSGLFIQSLNDLIDSYGRRDAALSRHVPEVVFFLVFATFLMAGSILGYASGIAGVRAPFATIMMAALIVLLVFLIIDLDRPRRGLIQVSQRSLEDLQQTIARSGTRAAQPGSAPDASKATRR